MSIYGYCRISTAKQSIDRQIRNIKAEYPTAHIVQEAYTGTSITRPEWLKLYRILRAGDVVVFDSVSRMSRNTLSFLCGLHHFFIRCVQPTKPNVFEQRGIEQVLILCHIGDTAVECFKTHIA